MVIAVNMHCVPNPGVRPHTISLFFMTTLWVRDFHNHFTDYSWRSERLNYLPPDQNYRGTRLLPPSLDQSHYSLGSLLLYNTEMMSSPLPRSFSMWGKLALEKFTYVNIVVKRKREDPNSCCGTLDADTRCSSLGLRGVSSHLRHSHGVFLLCQWGPAAFWQCPLHLQHRPESDREGQFHSHSRGHQRGGGADVCHLGQGRGKNQSHGRVGQAVQVIVCQRLLAKRPGFIFLVNITEADQKKKKKNSHANGGFSQRFY